MLPRRTDLPITKPSSALRNHYKEVAELCRETSEPVLITTNGENDLVVMSYEGYLRREAETRLDLELLRADADMSNGRLTEHSAVFSRLKERIGDA